MNQNSTQGPLTRFFFLLATVEGTLHAQKKKSMDIEVKWFSQFLRFRKQWYIFTNTSWVVLNWTQSSGKNGLHSVFFNVVKYLSRNVTILCSDNVKLCSFHHRCRFYNFFFFFFLKRHIRNALQKYQTCDVCLAKKGKKKKKCCFWLIQLCNSSENKSPDRLYWMSLHLTWAQMVMHQHIHQLIQSYN